MDERQEQDILIRQMLIDSQSFVDVLADPTPIAFDIEQMKWLNAREIHERDLKREKAAILNDHPPENVL